MRLLRPDGAALGLLILAFALVAPAGAAATVRYTSPGGTVASGPCTDAAGTCAIDHLFNVAADGDELVLKPGSYGSPSARLTQKLQTNKNGLNVHATRGAPARIYSSYGPFDNALEFTGTNVTLSDVLIDASQATALFIRTGLAQRVVAHGNGAGCVPQSATIVDSLCHARNGIGVFLNAGASGPTVDTIVLRNDTVVGTKNGIDLTSGAFVAIDATLSNVIASGGPGFYDIKTANASGNGVTVHVGYSNFDTQNAGTSTAIDTTPGHNQTAAPVFANAAGGDFHEASGSPTIDKGVTDAANGGFDWEGLPRVFGAGTDIGADEFAPATVVTGAASAVTTTGAHLAGTLTPNGSAIYYFQYGTASTYGKNTAVGSTSGTTAQSVSAAVAGLAPGTTYHYRLVATNSSGTKTGADRTFTTISALTPPALTPPTISNLTASRRVFRVARSSTPLMGVTSRRHKKGTTFSFRLDKAASVTVRIERKLRGRRVKGRCRRATRRLRHRPRCTRYVRKVTLKRTGHAGLNKVRFTGRVHGRALRPGRYRATFRASNSAGKSKRARLRFRIVRR